MQVAAYGVADVPAKVRSTGRFGSGQVEPGKQPFVMLGKIYLQKQKKEEEKTKMGFHRERVLVLTVVQK